MSPDIPTPGGVRNRAWKLKSDHRKTYEECGISMPGSQAVSKVANKSVDGPMAKPSITSTPKGGKKRGAKELGNGNDDHFSGVTEKMHKKVKKGDIDDFELEGGLGGIPSENDEI